MGFFNDNFSQAGLSKRRANWCNAAMDGGAKPPFVPSQSTTAPPVAPKKPLPQFDDGADLLNAADKALYEAKEAGRNAIRLAETDTTPRPITIGQACSR